VPAFVEHFPSAHPDDDSALLRLPDLRLYPDDVPLAMCLRDPSMVAVALHAEDGRTVVRTWTWDLELSRLVAADEALFEGQAGTVTSLDFDHRTAALLPRVSRRRRP
jgi:hypothetical protein